MTSLPARAAALHAVALLALLAGVGGCVERTLKISSQPPGARVFVNDEEVGVTPLKFSFTWYGDYDVILRKTGYQTLKTHHRVAAPWFQWSPLDFFFEILWPTTLRDEQVMPELALQPAAEPTNAELIDRAVELRDRTLFTNE